MEQNKKISWRDFAHDLAEDPKAMQSFITTFGRGLQEVSPQLAEWWKSLSPMEQTLRAITMFKQFEDENIQPTDLTNVDDSTNILPNQNET